MSPVNPGSREPFTRYFLQSFPTFSSVYPSQPSLIFPRSNLFSLLSVPTFSNFFPSKPSLHSIRTDRLSFYPPQPYLLLSVETFTSCILPNLLCFFPRPNFLYFYLSLPYILLSVSTFFSSIHPNLSSMVNLISLTLLILYYPCIPAWSFLVNLVFFLSHPTPIPVILHMVNPIPLT